MYLFPLSSTGVVGFAQAVNANAVSSPPALCNVGCAAVAVDGLH